MQCDCSVSGSGSLLIPLLCSSLGLVGLLAILLLVVFHNRQLRRTAAHHRLHLLRTPTTTKSNNQSQTSGPPITRFRNPLFDTDKGGGTSGGGDATTAASDLIDLDLDVDLEKYEKSPRRYAGLIKGSKDSNLRESKSNVPSLKKLPMKKKETNVELQRTRQSGDREAVL